MGMYIGLSNDDVSMEEDEQKEQAEQEEEQVEEMEQVEQAEQERVWWMLEVK